MIEATGLVKSYGDRVAVDDVSLQIGAGETFGLLGPNGAGKSTTIHCLIGSLRPDRGRVDIGGGGAPTDAEVRRKIGLAPQELAIYAELTGEENLRFFGRLYGLAGSRLRERVDWALEFSGLQDRRRDRVEQYSGGMKRRLNLACALVHDPQVLFLDEPTVGVDPQSRNHMFENVERLAQQGRTILYTTHYMEEAARLCDRVAIMDRGKILALDTVDRLIDSLGGRSRITLELDSAQPSGVELPAEPDGGTVRFETGDPMGDLRRLSDRGVSFTSLHVDRPDLESVFLNLTGRSLRD